MFLNTLSLMMVIVSALSSLLALAMGALIARVLRKCGKSPTGGGVPKGFARTIQLILFLSPFFLLFRLVSYPLLYVTLQSFVSDMEEAMCIYGVSQASPLLFSLLNIFKLLVFFCVGQWLIVHHLTRFQKALSLTYRKLRFLLGVSIGILIECLGEVVFLLRIHPLTHATCCAPKLDYPDRIPALVSRYLLGGHYEEPLLLAYYFSNLVILGLIGYLFLRRRIDATAIRTRWSLSIISGMALINFFLAWLALLEVLGPKIMNLPLHHCPFCLLQYEPDSCILIALFILGTFSVWWAFGLTIFVGHEDLAESLSRYLRNLSWVSFSCLGASLILVTTHLLLGSQ